jgi:hypothetical protein
MIGGNYNLISSGHEKNRSSCLNMTARFGTQTYQYNIEAPQGNC